jgi:hypothetical protein
VFERFGFAAARIERGGSDEMTCKDGWLRARVGVGRLAVRAVALCLFVSAPAEAGDAEREGRPSTGGLVRLREGVSPEEAALEGAAADAAAAQSSEQGLEETAGVTAAGGTTVHLRGRFRSSSVLTRDAAGTTSAECTANLPASSRPH